MLDCLHRLGYDVDVILITRQPAVESRWTRRHRFHHVPVPGMPRVALNAARAVLTRRRSLNECLYQSPRVRRKVLSLVSRMGADVAVADSLRLADYAEATGLPYLVDLDDLLSERYAGLARSGGDNSELLGFFGQAMPRWALRPAGAAARASLGWEAGACRRRELDIARSAPAVSLVSEIEARRLSALSGSTVLTLPPGVAVTPAARRAAVRRDLVFLGGLDYQANVDALRWYLDHVVPYFGSDVLTVRVIGHCPPAVMEQLRSPHLVFEGYVDDLQQALDGGAALIAPIVSGSGVKTKVLDAMACALPVVGTELAFSGLDVTDGVEVYVGRDAAHLADHVRTVLGSPAHAVEVGLRGQRYVAANFSLDVVRARWQQALSTLIEGDRAGTPRA